MDYRNKAAGEQWQGEAWRFFDIIGEFEFAAAWVGNLLSRATLGVKKAGKDVDPADKGAQLMSTFFGSEEGRSQFLRGAGIHHTVAGEFVVVSYTKGGEDIWRLAAPQNVRQTGSSWEINGVALTDITGDPFRLRVWNPHPRHPEKANSPARAALPILAEIEKLSMHVAATVDSRLASAGILFLPNEMAFSSTTSEKDGTITSRTGTQAFIHELQKVAGTSIRDRSDASALVPIVVTADGEILDKVHHLAFSSKLDEQAMALRSEAIRRLALSLDMPPEVLLGTGDTNHWSAAQVDEAAIKSHTEPLLLRICADLTEGYLVPGLKELGMSPEEALLYSVVADTSKIRLRPNRSKEALELYDRGHLSGKALLRETGFDVDADAPDAEELRFFLLMKMATGSATPEMVAEANRLLGVSEMKAIGDQVNPAPAPRSLKDHPDKPLVPTDESQKRGDRRMLNAAAEQMVFRALERCGNKMKTKLHVVPPKGVEPAEAYLFHQVPGAEIDSMLEGSFAQVERFADRYGVYHGDLSSALEGYCRTLIAGQKHHSAVLLAAALDSLEVSHV